MELIIHNPDELVRLDPVPGSKCWNCSCPVSVDFSPFCCEECEFEYNKVRSAALGTLPLSPVPTRSISRAPREWRRRAIRSRVGECIWVGDGRWGKRVGIKDAAGNAHWTAIDNVEVVTGKEVI